MLVWAIDTEAPVRRPESSHQVLRARTGSLAFAALALLGAAASSGVPSRATVAATGVKPRVLVGYGKLPLHFEANQGQTAGPVTFLARGSGYGLFLTPTESVLILRKTKDAETWHRMGERERATARATEQPAVLRMKLLGANPRPVVAGREELPGKSNYFIGNDPKKWRTNVPQYARVDYQEIYPGVSLAYYGNQGQLEYDFVVSPGGDPRRIRLGIEGAEQIHVDAEGNLVLSLLGGEVVEKAPVVYQEVGGAR